MKLSTGCESIKWGMRLKAEGLEMGDKNGSVDRERGQENLQSVNGDSLRKADRVGLLVTSLPKWVAVSVIAWQAGISLEALASKNALASLLIERFGRETSYWEVICWVAGILGILFGLHSRRLLRRQSALDSARLNALEQRLNLVPHSATIRPSQ